MTNANITDINAYRAEHRPLARWSDAKLRSRFAVLKQIENGADFLTDIRHPLARRAWPEGFNPGAHPGENIRIVTEEAERRGVTLT